MYWDKVDAQLLLICTMADGKAWKITKYVMLLMHFLATVLILSARAFKHILQTDWTTYSNDVTYTLESGSNDFQDTVDNIVARLHMS